MDYQATNSDNAERLSASNRSHLGLVCVTFSDEVRFRTITRTRYLKFSETEQRSILEELYHDNLRRLHTALTYCEQHGIKLYRLSSDLFPMGDDALGTQILEEMSQEMAEIGQRVARLGLRVVIHPDQFIVLNSESPQVVQNSLKLLERHARTLDLFGLPQSAWTVMMIHGGKSGRSEQLVETIRQLPENIRCRFALENDEYAYGASAILDICQRTGVAMVFDLHHFVVNEKLDTYEDPRLTTMLRAARETWPVPEWQMVHISNGKEAFNDRRHSDLITIVPTILKEVPWIEVEAKSKEQAIEHLRELWPDAD